MIPKLSHQLCEFYFYSEEMPLLADVIDIIRFARLHLEYVTIESPYYNMKMYCPFYDGNRYSIDTRGLKYYFKADDNKVLAENKSEHLRYAQLPLRYYLEDNYLLHALLEGKNDKISYHFFPRSVDDVLQKFFISRLGGIIFITDIYLISGYLDIELCEIIQIIQKVLDENNNNLILIVPQCQSHLYIDIQPKWILS